MRNLLIFILLVMAAVPSQAATYYISKSTGADSNNGTSKATPWAHMPGMASCASNCAGHTPVAGDTFTLMGCDVWVNSDLPIHWDWSGSAGNVITIGVDKTWYNTTNCPSAWNRPIWDGQKQDLSGGNREMVHLAHDNNTSYVTLDNVEMRGGHCAGATCTAGGNLTYITSYNSTTYWTISNLYLHAWDYAYDDCTIVAAAASTGTVFTKNIIDGSDRTGAVNVGGYTGTCYGIYPTQFPTETYNVIHDLPNGAIGHPDAGGVVEFGGNLIYNIIGSNGGSHANFFEVSGTIYVHDNVFHDATAGLAPETAFIGGPGDVDYLWNNVWYNLQGGISTGSTDGGTASLTMWNNTIAPGASNYCLGAGHPQTSVTVVYENNHCITTSGSAVQSSSSFPSPTTDHNVLQTPTAANANTSPNFDQFNSSETYVYSPAAFTNSTVGAGVNLTANCSGFFTSLCSDTAYAVIYNPNTQTVTVPGRTTNGRPPSGNWDAGAYQTPPGPASNLHATPN